MAKLTYTAVLERDAEGGFGITFPEFPGCVSGADDLEHARAMGAEALQLHVKGMAEDGLPLPRPRALNDLDPEDLDGAEALIPVTIDADKVPSVEIERVNVTFPKPLLERIDAYVADQGAGASRSGFLALAARRYLASETPSITYQQAVAAREAAEAALSSAAVQLREIASAWREGQGLEAGVRPDLERAIDELTGLSDAVKLSQAVADLVSRATEPSRMVERLTRLPGEGLSVPTLPPGRKMRL